MVATWNGRASERRERGDRWWQDGPNVTESSQEPSQQSEGIELAPVHARTCGLT
jgi:hypothetical protein